MGQTDAQRRFEEVQRQRVRYSIRRQTSSNSRPYQLQKRVAKMAKQTHKDRVHEFNEKLESLSEHHDIPKVRSATSLVSPRYSRKSRSGQVNMASCRLDFSFAMSALYKAYVILLSNLHRVRRIHSIVIPLLPIYFQAPWALIRQRPLAS